MVIWWYGLIWYVLRSPLRPLARPCIFDASISCSQNPISPEDVIERTGLFINPQLQSCKYSQCPHHMLPACWRHLLCLLNCPQGKLGCISCTGPAVWQSLFLCTPRQIQLSSSFLFTCNWTSPKSDWAALVTLTKKGRKVSKTWWGEWIIGWRKLEHFSALMRRSLTDKRHTASYLGSPSMSHQVPNGNRLSPRQLDPISHSPRQYLYIVVLSSSFIW